MMKNFLLVLLALMLLAPLAQAQLGAYGTLVAVKITNGSAAQALALNATNTGYWTTGAGGGLYYDAWHLGPVSVGMDARGSSSTQAKMGLFGARVAAHPPILPVKPYVEGLVGLANTTNIYNAKNSDLAYELVGGVDYTIIPHFDFRVLEVGGGKISTGITTTATPTRSIFTVSTGLAIHF